MTATSRRSGGPPSIWPKLWTRAIALIRLWIDVFSRHQILNSASAISFLSLKALVPLALFGLALLRLLGAADVWTNTLAAGAYRHLTPTAFIALDTAVENARALATARR